MAGGRGESPLNLDLDTTMVTLRVCDQVTKVALSWAWTPGHSLDTLPVSKVEVRGIITRALRRGRVAWTPVP